MNYSQEEIVDIIISTINLMFSNLFSSIDNNIYESLDKFVFIDSSILDNNFFVTLLGKNGKTGFIYLCDAMLLGIFIFYIVKYYYSNIVDYTIERPSQFIFKLLLFAIFSHFSYFILEQIINLNFLFSSSIQSIGAKITKCDVSFSDFIIFINKNLSVSNSELNIFSFDGIIKSFVTVGLISLLLTYSLRYILVQVFSLISPFAFLSLINSNTSWIFKSWSKCFFSLLIIQFFIPIVMIIIFSISSTNKILLVAGIYTLTKINNYIREMFGGISTDFNTNVNNIISLLKK